MPFVFPDATPKGPRIKPGGIGQYFDQPFWTGTLTEVHHSTCFHCGAGSEFPSLKMMEHVDICRGCMKLICLRCVGKPCTPQEAECDRIEREQRLNRRIEQDAWGCY
jgi:hypothetical protein